MASEKYFIIVIMALAFFLVSGPVVFSKQNFVVTIRESGKITSYYDEYYIVQVYGNLTLSNKENSSLFDVKLPLRLPGVGIRTLNKSARMHLDDMSVGTYALDPLSNQTVEYKISGITSQEIRTDQPIMMTAFELYGTDRIYSNLMATLRKSEIENQSAGRPSRLITVEVKNPTGYWFKVDRFEVIKTKDLNPSQQLRKWNFPEDYLQIKVDGKGRLIEVGMEKEHLYPYETWTMDILDDNASEGEVYWVTTDIYIEDFEFVLWSNISVYTVEDLIEILENQTNITENVSDISSFFEERLFVRKFVSDNHMTYGKTINVTLLINNLDSTPITPFLEDPIPSGFRLVSTSGNSSLRRSNVSWSNFRVGARGSERFTYSLFYGDNDSLGLDYFLPARLVSKNQEIFSQAIPFIRKYIPEKKIFLQKKVRMLSDEDIEVVIQLQNLGEAGLDNIVLKEYLDETNEFKEVTQKFESKGVWKIPSIEQGATWETKYVTDQKNVLSTLPEIYGVPSSSVFRTIIMSHEVSSTYSLFGRKAIETIGIIVLVVSVVYYLLPQRLIRNRRKKDTRKLAVIEGELSSLRTATGTKSGEVEATPKTILQRLGGSRRHEEAAAHKPKAPQPVNDSGKEKRREFEDEIRRNQELLEKMKANFSEDK